MQARRVVVIGGGRVGRTLGRLIRERKVGKVVAVCNSSMKSSHEAVNFIGEGVPLSAIKHIPAADIYFITTKDDFISSANNHLLDSSIPSGATILHCSGYLNSDILAQARNRNCHVASVHPIKSFAKPELAIKDFEGTICAFEGDKEAFEPLKELFTGIGGVMVGLNKDHKKRYHAACVIANNFAVTLHHMAMETFKLSGINEEIANRATNKLMGDALNNLSVLPHQQALTGPLQRGDVKTIQGHLDALADFPEILNLYKALALKTLPITNLSVENKKELEKLVSDISKIKDLESNYKFKL